MTPAQEFYNGFLGGILGSLCILFIFGVIILIKNAHIESKKKQ